MRILPFKKFQSQVAAAIASLLAIMCVGTVFYRYAENWSWIDSLYFSVVSLTTTGYGDLAPTSAGARLFTVFYLLSGASVTVAALGIIGAGYLERRSERINRRRSEQEAGRGGNMVAHRGFEPLLPP